MDGIILAVVLHMTTLVPALACETREGFSAAYNARQYGWLDRRTREQLTPEDFGCRMLPKGTEVEVRGKTFAHALTNYGWVHRNDLEGTL